MPLIRNLLMITGVLSRSDHVDSLFAYVLPAGNTTQATAVRKVEGVKKNRFLVTRRGMSSSSAS
jgi:hypothetical protein